MPRNKKNILESPIGFILMGIAMYIFLLTFNKWTEEPTYTKESSTYNESGLTEEITTYTVESHTEETESDQEDIELLAHLIYAEAGADWCEYRMKYMVGAVVLNRVDSNLFPNNIKDVIYQKGQYACVVDGHINNQYTAECYQIAEELIKYGSNIPKDVLFQAEFKQGSEVYAKVQNMYFCYR